MDFLSKEEKKSLASLGSFVLDDSLESSSHESINNTCLLICRKIIENSGGVLNVYKTTMLEDHQCTQTNYSFTMPMKVPTAADIDQSM